MAPSKRAQPRSRLSERNVVARGSRARKRRRRIPARCCGAARTHPPAHCSPVRGAPGRRRARAGRAAGWRVLGRQRAGLWAPPARTSPPGTPRGAANSRRSLHLHRLPRRHPGGGRLRWLRLRLACPQRGRRRLRAGATDADATRACRARHSARNMRAHRHPRRRRRRRAMHALCARQRRVGSSAAVAFADCCGCGVGHFATRWLCCHPWRVWPACGPHSVDPLWAPRRANRVACAAACAGVYSLWWGTVNRLSGGGGDAARAALAGTSGGSGAASWLGAAVSSRADSRRRVPPHWL